MTLKHKTHDHERIAIVQSSPERLTRTENAPEPLSPHPGSLARVITKAPAALRPADILTLQRSAGNQVVQRMLAVLAQRTRAPELQAPRVIQAKLTIGAAGDRYEQEADRVARQVMSMGNKPASSSIQRAGKEDLELQRMPSAIPITSLLQREMKPEDEEQQGLVQRQATHEAATAGLDIENAIGRARGSGQSLPDDVRIRMERAFGADFSDVRVHTNAQADELNRSLQARAFTTGPDLFFKRGTYAPESHHGQELIAHELTHVLQQKGAASGPRQDKAQGKQPAATTRPASAEVIMRDLDQKAVDTALDQAVTDHKLKALTRGELRGKTYAKQEDLTAAINKAVNAQHHPTLNQWLKKLGLADPKGNVHYWKKVTASITSKTSNDKDATSVTYKTHLSVFQNSVTLPAKGVNDTKDDILTSLFAGEGTSGPHITLERKVATGMPHYYYDGTEKSNMSQQEETDMPKWNNLKNKMKDVLKDEKKAAEKVIDTVIANKAI